jgi:hypothetical protein
MSPTVVPRRKSKMPIRLGPFLSSFFCKSGSVFSGFFPGFSVSCQIVPRFPAACFLVPFYLGTVVICYSSDVFLRVHKRHSEP